MSTISPLSCPDADEIAAFVAARLAPIAVRRLEDHVAHCQDCRRVLSALARSEAPAPSAAGPRDADSLTRTLPLHRAVAERTLAAGTPVGRYLVLARLGEGGMGVVYAAYDPELERKVALKLLRGEGRDDEAQALLHQRLRREARTMARLAHPNVVTVHDVGDFADRIFVAMELVDGETLAHWLASAPRRWREVLAAFEPAGHGLAAAHAAGIVHRDFKPENVFIGRDRRVRVGDFGLARSRLQTADGSTSLVAPMLVAGGDGDSITGGLVGTPYYMAPEQLVGAEADERSDQFSFCVALYLAISGEHPFDGADAEARAKAVVHGRLRTPARRGPMPRWLRRVLLRGLSIDPAARYPSMALLLAALARDRSRRRMLVGGALVAALAVAGVSASQRASTPACLGAESRWAGVWDDARAHAVDAAFAATRKPYAASAAAQVRRSLDAYRAAWIAMHTDACLATRVRGEQSGELLDKRMMCLEAHLRDARALIARFVAADDSVVERAPRMQLGELAGCADLQALSSQVPLPRLAATRTRVEALRGELAELRATRLAGRDDEALPRARALAARARATQYRPLEAEVLFEQGWLEDGSGDYAAAKRAFGDAVWAAEAGRHDALAARAWTRLMFVDGSRLAHHADALALTPRVTALLERLGGDDEVEGMLHLVSAQLLYPLDRFADAGAQAEQARALFERRFGADDLRVADALDELGRMNLEGSTARARAFFERVLAIRTAVYGDAHPEVARALNHVAMTHHLDKRYAAAIVPYERALAIFEGALAHQHPELAKTAHNLAFVYQEQRRGPEALALNQRAVDIGAAAFGRDHPTYAHFLMSLGSALALVDRPHDALTTMREALAILERRLGPDHSTVGICLERLAALQHALGRYVDAREAAARSVRIAEQVHGPTSPNLRKGLLYLGHAELALAHPRRALAPLERAHALHADADADPDQRAQVAFLLGRALVESKIDRRRGLALVRSARTDAATDARSTDMAEVMDHWLAARAP